MICFNSQLSFSHWSSLFLFRLFTAFFILHFFFFYFSRFSLPLYPFFLCCGASCDFIHILCTFLIFISVIFETECAVILYAFRELIITADFSRLFFDFIFLISIFAGFPFLYCDNSNSFSNASFSSYSLN
jgi:hypothetical protein